MNYQDDKMKDLGWMNGWTEDPPEYTECRKKGHKTHDVDIGPPYRGLHHVVTCEICNLKWHYDSSD